jgi:hypothetical protein
LRFIREIHVMDPWFHLNKTEQIVGRGIRYCSHSLLPVEQRNTTVFLHAVQFTDEEYHEYESADLYTYRTALRKAMLMGEMSRKLKEYAVDCNLKQYKDSDGKTQLVTVLKGLGDRAQTDSQRNEREHVSLDDTDFTALCDWMECDYKCQPEVPLPVQVSDDSTYDAFSAQYRESMLQKIIRNLFERQPAYPREQLEQMLLVTRAPELAIQLTLRGIINNPTFRVKSGAQEGYIIYKNNYFIFQPDAYQDTKIPLALRIAAWPIKEDVYTPTEIKVEEAEGQEQGAVLDEVEQQPIQFTQRDLWEKLREWVDMVYEESTEDDPVEISDVLKRYIKETTDIENLQELYETQLLMISELMGMVDHRNVFKRVVLEYLWDQWINPREQVRLLLTNDESVREISPEQILSDGGIRAVRVVNPSTNTLEFYCDGGVLCSPRIANAFGQLDVTKDPVKSVVANVTTSGPLYGFIVPKYGILVFKTVPPSPVGEKPERGQECESTSVQTYYLTKHILLGNVLREADLNDFGLLKEMPKKRDTSYKYLGVGKACAIIQLVLRYLDKLHVGGKRWFYRPIASYFTKHTALIRQTTLKKGKTLGAIATGVVAAGAAAAGGGGGGAAEQPRPVLKATKTVGAIPRITLKKKVVVTEEPAAAGAAAAGGAEGTTGRGSGGAAVDAAQEALEARRAAQEAEAARRAAQEAEAARRAAQEAEARRAAEEAEARRAAEEAEARRVAQEAEATRAQQLAEEARRAQQEAMAVAAQAAAAQAAAAGGGGAAEAPAPKKKLAKKVTAGPQKPVVRNVD